MNPAEPATLAGPSVQPGPDTLPANGPAVPLAVVGIGCLFPGAENLRAYWSNIVNRVDGITDVPPTHWRPEDYLHADPKAPDRIYTARGGFLRPVPFNPGDFGIAPANLEAIDTAQLLGLVVAQQALADAGYLANPASLDRSRTAVLLGVTGTLELVIPLGARLGHPIWRRALREAGVEDAVAEDVVQRIGEAYVGWQENSFPGLLGNVVAGRIANRFDLGGTNCVIDAACASSLSALHLAALELTTGRADAVLTGGVDTFNDIFMYMCFSKTPALSPTGNARPFDAAGDGTILGEGLGMVVLKRLTDARRDGDRIYAILRGIGSSSDGKGNAVYAPRVEGQMAALRRAYQAAGVSPATIELVEAHGTGTRVGDATEVAALTEVYRDAGRSGTWCALGSVKSQIGHTKAAAGAAGLIKTIAALYHKVLPPTIKVEQPLEGLQPGRSPFYVNTEKRPWLPCDEHPRRAALSAFGFGGSNFHCVVEEADPRKATIDWDGTVQILAFSGDSHEQLGEQLAAWPTDLSWEELSRRATEQRTAWRPDGSHRLLLVVQRERTDLKAQLERARSLLTADAEKSSWRGPDGIYFGRGEAPGQLAVLFPGQGAQYVGMLRDLACHFPAAHDTLAEANRVFQDGLRLSDLIYPLPVFSVEERSAQETALRETQIAQPALGAVSLGAWRVLEEFGLHADAFAGHSYGELTALAAAGRLDGPDFHCASRERGRLMAAACTTCGGSMLAVMAAPEAIVAVLRDEGLELVLANKNAPQQTVLSGRNDDIDRAAAAFTARQIRVQRLAVAAAFHSPLVADAQTPFRAALAPLAFHPGRGPVYANTTAAPYPDDADAARDLLARQLAHPVEFVREIEALYEAGVRAFLEVGPGARLTGLVGLILHGRAHETQALDSSTGQRSGFFDLACTLAWLAALGYRPRLAAWDAPVSSGASNQETKKRGLTVPICGANYVKPKPARPPRFPAERTVSAATPRIPATMNGSRIPPEPAAMPTTDPHPRTNGEVLAPAAPVPTAARAPADVPALTQALQMTRESMAALLKVQEQTAQLHRQFLEGQEKAQRTVHLLVEQQQRLLQASLGLTPTAPAVSAVPSLAPPASVIPALQPAPSPAPVPPVALAPTSPPAVSAPPPPTPVAHTVSTSRVERVLLEVVAEKTGYPVEMLEPAMALDADLGIDSIKRVEILSALQERLPDAPAVTPEHLGSLQTLRHIIDFLASGRCQSPDSSTTATTIPQGVDTPRSPVTAVPVQHTTPINLERSVLEAVPLETQNYPPIQLALGAEIWIVAEEDELSRCLSRRLQEQGFRPRVLPCAALRVQTPPDTLGGLILLAPVRGIEDRFLQEVLFGLQRIAPALRPAAQQNHTILLTISRLDGRFGLAQLDPTRPPLDGGLAGLAKTASQEWPEVNSKAIDLAADFTDPEAASAALIDEAFRSGPLEVGISSIGRVTLERSVRVLPAGPAAAPLQRGDVVVISGGARGVTAEVAVTLARAYQPTLILLGRSLLPEREPDWLIPLVSEADIKRELSLRANGDASPKLIGEQYRQVTAQREIRQTLARIQEAGARVLYRAVDVRDAAAVAAVLGPLRTELGPIRGLIHGAGVLADALIADKTPEQFERVYTTKVDGLRSLLGCLDPNDLRLLVLFSSITGRLGRKGQVDYAIANEVLNKLAQQQARRLPGCRVVAVNWGPWDGGMVTSSLKRLFAAEGVGLIPLDEGANYLIQEISQVQDRAVEVVVLAAASAAQRPATLATRSLPVAFERTLTVSDHPILAAHILDGRPVLPLALTHEWLAHAALHQNPGLVYHGCNDLHVLHGVILDEPPPTVQVAAGKAVKDGNYLRAPVEMRGSREGREVLYARAEVVLATDMPRPPAARPEPALQPYPHSIEAVYAERLFHGPQLQGIEQIEGYSQEGLAARVRSAPPPANWLRNILRQKWLADPLVFDTAFQLMILWTLEQFQAHALPCRIARYRQYCRAFPADGVRLLLRITRANGLHALADIDFLDNTGQVVARMEECECAIDAGLRRAFGRRQLIRQ